MILSGSYVKRLIEKDIWQCNIPPSELHVNPNSIDVPLSDIMLKRKSGVTILGKKFYQSADFEKCEIEDYKGLKGFWIDPGEFYLGSVSVKFNANNGIRLARNLFMKSYFAPMYETRSSIARCGLITHLTAGFGDYGFTGFFTLEISNLTMHRIFVEIGIRIGQVYFQQTYNGWYNQIMYNSVYNKKQSESSLPIVSKGAG